MRCLMAPLPHLAAEAEPQESLRRRLLKKERAPQTLPGRTHRAPRLLESRSWIPAWAWAAATALVLFTLFSIRQAQRLKGELTALRSQVELQRLENQTLHADRQLYQRALAILSAPNTREIILKPTQHSLPEVHALRNPELGLLVSGRQIPLPAADRTFQLWVMLRHGNSVSAGIFRPNTAGEVLHVLAAQTGILEATALAITDEPAGGAHRPTTKPLWVASVR